MVYEPAGAQIPMLQPLADLDDARLSHVRGVVFDIDDTITRNGRVESVAYESLWQLADADLTLIAVTGRPLGWIDVLARLWPVHLAVGENGAGWAWREQDRMREGYYLDAASRRRAEEALERLRVRVLAEMPHVKTTDDHRARRCDLAFDVAERAKLSEDDVEALRHIITDEGLEYSVSSVHAHAAPGDWNKARGVVRAANDALGRDLSAELERWLFIGDSPNDEAAFAFFPLSVGVSNVRSHRSRMNVLPAWVTQADHGRGFAEMAARLLRVRT